MSERERLKKYYDVNAHAIAKSRLLKRLLRQDFEPNASTLRKYGITYKQINAFRKANGLPEYDVASFTLPSAIPIIPIPSPTYTPCREISFATMADHFVERSRLNPSFPMSTAVKNQHGITKLLLKAGYDATSRNVLPVFEHVEQLINAVTELSKDKEYTNSTLLHYYQTILVYFDQHLLIPGVLDGTLANSLVEQRNKVKKLFTHYKAVSQADTAQRVASERVSPFSDIFEAVTLAFPKDSQEVLYINLYKELSARNDFSHLHVITDDSDMSLDVDDPSKNFCFVPADPEYPVIIYLNHYKTAGLYGQVVTTLSKNLSKMIRHSLEKKPRNYLFIQNKYYNTLEKQNQPLNSHVLYLKGMSRFVKNMLDKASGHGKFIRQVTEDGVRENIKVGSISLLRKSVISELMSNPEIDASMRVDLAKKMMHSPNSQLAYVRSHPTKFLHMPPRYNSTLDDEPCC